MIPEGIAEAIRASYERQETRERQRMQEAGEIGFELVRAHDDPAVGSLEFQRELVDFYSQLGVLGVPYSARHMTFDAVDGGGFTLGEFTVLLKDVAPAIATVLIAWIKVHYGRATTIIVNGKAIEVTADQPEDAEHAIEHIIRLQSELKKEQE